MSFRVLTVGDGDLSFSLALKRAYPQINVTASTLVESPAELCRTYTNAVETFKEFQETWKEQIIYGADATKIEACGVGEKFDMILFNHPHLGDGTLMESEQRHAERHFALLSHYFFSAKKLLRKDGRVHVCLCGNQPKTWNVLSAAENSGLLSVSEESTACPVGKWLFNEEDDYRLADTQSHYPTKRKFRNGSLGSKHFLARYGYRHRRTEGDLFDGSVKHINVEQSINFVFACKPSTEQKAEHPCGEHACSICKLKFENKEQLIAHLDAPGLPDIVTGAYSYHKKNDGGEKVQQNQTDSTNVGKKQHDPSPPFKSINIEDATVLIEATVDSSFDSKRIKWLCRQDGFPLSKYIKSKSKCEDAIRKGRVFINQEVALDSSRIVRENDVVSLIEGYEPSQNIHKVKNGSEDSHVRVVKEVRSQNKELTIEVAFKPVGIRCVGSFSSNTLEMITKKHVECSLGTNNMFCCPVSKLDTGCAGLCVLAASSSKIDAAALHSLKVNYTFTALVHGCPPEEWKKGVFVQVPTEGLRQWKRQKTNELENSASDDGDMDGKKTSSIAISKTALDLDDALFIQCHDSLQVEGQQLISTLTVQSRFDNGRLANVISFVLRKLGYPVVNDRFGKREYSALPRRIKNIVKQKICIGCYCLDVEYEGVLTTVRIDSHKRTLCSFWREPLDEN